VGGGPGNPADIYGGVATAAFTPGYQDVVFGSTYGWNIIDGRSGALLLPHPTTTSVNLDGEYVNWNGTIANLNIQSTPLITPDPLGGMDVVLAGTYAPADPSQNSGFVAVYQVLNAPTDGAGTGSWPMFHHDPQHTGASAPPALRCAGCVPPGPDRGYRLAAADGGVFAFGDAGYYGSMGGQPLARPVVGMTPTPDGRGYWLVASDGGVFAFGDAGFFGSLGGRHLAAPVVGMAAAGDGLGYWMVGSDGGVFAFGQAVFHGSMGGSTLARPVVGMALTPGSGGYWLVGSDGGVFAFGAPFSGSMGAAFLAAPVVGLSAPAPDVSGGYWEVSADGGVFAFGGAPFYGSTGGVPLAAPVVAITPT
jgi:hypothetical protein